MMPSVTARPARPIGYKSFLDLTDVNPSAITTTADGTMTVTFPDAPVTDPPTPALVSEETLTLVFERMTSRDDVEMAQRIAIKAALLALQNQPPLPDNPTLDQRVARLEGRDALYDQLVYPLACLFGMAAQ